MQATCQKWQELHQANSVKPIMNEGFVEVSYEVKDPNLPPATVGANRNNLARLSHMPNTQNPPLIDDIEREIRQYSTLEENLWLLDGSKITVPQNYVPNTTNTETSGFISNDLCNSIGNFFVSTAPLLIIDFPNAAQNPPFMIPGLTIKWSENLGEYATGFIMQLNYIDENNITRALVIDIPDNREAITSINFDDYLDDDTYDPDNIGLRRWTSIGIMVFSWSRGNRRARVENILLGINKTFTKRDLLNFSASEEINFVSASLPKYEISFEVANNSNENAFGRRNRSILSRYMLERQEIRTRYGLKMDHGEISWIDGGTYFLNGWEIEKGGVSAKFVARDILGFMNETYHRGQYYENGISLYNLARDVLESASLPHLKSGKPNYAIDESLRRITTQSPLPMVSHAECLQLIANAANATITFDRHGTLHIKPLPTIADADNTHDINERNSYSRANLSLREPLKRVEVTAYGWRRRLDAMPTVHASEVSLAPGNHTFFFDHSQPITGRPQINYGNFLSWISTNDIIVVEEIHFANVSIVTLRNTWHSSLSGRIAIEAWVLEQSETTVAINNRTIGEVASVQNILVTDTNHAKALGEQLRDYYGRREQISVDWRTNPALDVTDFARISAEGENSQTMQILSSKMQFTGAFKSTIEGLVI